VRKITHQVEGIFTCSLLNNRLASHRASFLRSRYKLVAIFFLGSIVIDLLRAQRLPVGDVQASYEWPEAAKEFTSIVLKKLETRWLLAAQNALALGSVRRRLPVNPVLGGFWSGGNLLRLGKGSMESPYLDRTGGLAAAGIACCCRFCLLGNIVAESC